MGKNRRSRVKNGLGNRYKQDPFQGTLPVGIRSSHSGVSIMSTSLLVAKERQPGSPFGLGISKPKSKKIGRKCATVAPYFEKIRRKRATVARYSMLYRFLCNAMQRDPVQPAPRLPFVLCCYVPFHNNPWSTLNPPPSASSLSSPYT